MLDAIGTLYSSDAVIDDEGNIVRPATPLAGYHVNSTHELCDMGEYRIYPDSPKRVFKGSTTYHYCFASQQEAKALLNYDDETDLFYPEVEHILPVPDSVSARQGMEQMIRLGLDEQVDDAINAIEDVVQRKIVRNWLDKAGFWERHNPQFVAFVEKLGLTPEQADDYMRQAATL